MISLTKDFSIKEIGCAEYVKIKSLYDTYKTEDFVLFWVQNDGDAYISLCDGNMIILNISADFEELSEFVNVISPASVYSNYETLKKIDKTPKEAIFVLKKHCVFTDNPKSDEMKSDELYNILNKEGLSLPLYEYFAVDICRRLNRKTAKYFGIKNKCAAISFEAQNLSVINGIASNEKGFGSISLKGIMNLNEGKELFVCCRENIKGFYLKNGFEFCYMAGYWVKNI